uniref:non-specific serine/threonine protein kinase n=1 Tax=Salix viminalis TaxID=40686 RepID=A0A6N2NJS3_SALVM
MATSKKIGNKSNSNQSQSPLLGRYEIGKLLGHGTFAKVYHARNIKTNEGVAIKVIDKEKILKGGLIAHIKREISILRLVRHPYIVQLFEVMATKAKIYFVMEYVRGGELFNKVAKGRLKEEVARKYFQQLISAVSFCHARGVFHRDLKPENLLLDENGNLKVSDFGLSAVADQIRQDGLFHTFCGTPAYVAPEVLARKGYDAAKVDIWSCGIILFVLMAGFFSRLLDTNPVTRITIPEIMENRWFKKGFKNIKFYIEDDKVCSVEEDEDVGSSSDQSLSESESEFETRRRVTSLPRPASLNAFDIISFSPGFDLSGLFEEGGEGARFVSGAPVSKIISKLEEIANVVRFSVRKKDCRVSLEGSREGVRGPLTIAAEIFELTPKLVVVEEESEAAAAAANVTATAPVPSESPQFTIDPFLTDSSQLPVDPFPIAATQFPINPFPTDPTQLPTDPCPTGSIPLPIDPFLIHSSHLPSDSE